MGILASIGVQGFLYIALVTGALGGFAYFVHHERELGAAAVAAADQRTVAVAQERDTAVQTAAVLQTSIAEGKYDKIIKTPVVGIAPFKLYHDALCVDPVSATPASASSGDSHAVSGATDRGSNQALPDLATGLVTIGRNADAQITALQAEVAALRLEMQNGK
jgi:hypothetical protein